MPFSGDHWRKRADQLRVLAEASTDAVEEQLLRKLIAEYERLAARAGKREQKAP